MAQNLFNNRQLVSRGPHELLAACAEQVANNIRSTSPARLVIPQYFAKTKPTVSIGTQVELPFCVALVHSTVLYQLQSRYPPLKDCADWGKVLQDAARLVRQIAAAAADDRGLPDDDAGTLAMKHPFFKMLREWIFGLPSRQADDGNSPAPAEFTPIPHHVVLLSRVSFGAFSILVSLLLLPETDGTSFIPEELSNEFLDALEFWRCDTTTAPLVRERAGLLRLRCGDSAGTTPSGEREALLQALLIARDSHSVPVDALESLYHRLCRCIPMQGPQHAGHAERALCIAAADVLLAFPSKLRRPFCDQMLYPSLRSHDMSDLVSVPQTRLHLLTLLLRLMPPKPSPSGDSFYQCTCALVEPFFGDEPHTTAQLLLTMLKVAMPQGAFFIGSLSLDQRFAAETFGNVLAQLSRGLGLALTASGTSAALAEAARIDPVASLIGDDATLAYRVLFTLRFIVQRVLSASSSRRRTAMLKELQKALKLEALDALGQFIEAGAFPPAEPSLDVPYNSSTSSTGSLVFVPPILLVTELSMVLHGVRLTGAVDSLASFLLRGASPCGFCLKPLLLLRHCPLNRGSPHTATHLTHLRLLQTVATECPIHDSVAPALAARLRDYPLAPSTHFLIYEVLRRAHSHRVELYHYLAPFLDEALRQLVARVEDHRQRLSLEPIRWPPEETFETHFADPSLEVESVSLLSALESHVRIAALASTSTKTAGTPVVDGQAVRGGRFLQLTRALLIMASASQDYHHTIPPDARDVVSRVTLACWWAAHWLLRNAHPRCCTLPPTRLEGGGGGTSITTRPNNQQNELSSESPSTLAAAAQSAILLLEVLQHSQAHLPGGSRLAGYSVYTLSHHFALHFPLLMDYLWLRFFGLSQGMSELATVALEQPGAFHSETPVQSLDLFWRLIKSHLQLLPPFRVAFLVALAQAAGARFHNSLDVLDAPHMALTAPSGTCESKCPTLLLSLLQAMRFDVELRTIVLVLLRGGIRRWEQTGKLGVWILLIHLLQQLVGGLLLFHVHGATPQHSWLPEQSNLPGNENHEVVFWDSVKAVQLHSKWLREVSQRLQHRPHGKPLAELARVIADSCALTTVETAAAQPPPPLTPAMATGIRNVLTTMDVSSAQRARQAVNELQADVPDVQLAWAEHELPPEEDMGQQGMTMGAEPGRTGVTVRPMEICQDVSGVQQQQQQALNESDDHPLTVTTEENMTEEPTTEDHQQQQPIIDDQPLRLSTVLTDDQPGTRQQTPPPPATTPQRPSLLSPEPRRSLLLGTPNRPTARPLGEEEAEEDARRHNEEARWQHVAHVLEQHDSQMHDDGLNSLARDTPKRKRRVQPTSTATRQVPPRGLSSFRSAIDPSVLQRSNLNGQHMEAPLSEDDAWNLFLTQPAGSALYDLNAFTQSFVMDDQTQLRFYQDDAHLEDSISVLHTESEYREVSQQAQVAAEEARHVAGERLTVQEPFSQQQADGHGLYASPARPLHPPYHSPQSIHGAKSSSRHDGGGNTQRSPRVIKLASPGDATPTRMMSQAMQQGLTVEGGLPARPLRTRTSMSTNRTPGGYAHKKPTTGTPAVVGIEAFLQQRVDTAERERWEEEIGQLMPPQSSLNKNEHRYLPFVSVSRQRESPAHLLHTAHVRSLVPRTPQQNPFATATAAGGSASGILEPSGSMALLSPGAQRHIPTYALQDPELSLHLL